VRIVELPTAVTNAASPVSPPSGPKRWEWEDDRVLGAARRAAAANAGRAADGSIAPPCQAGAEPPAHSAVTDNTPGAFVAPERKPADRWFSEAVRSDSQYRPRDGRREFVANGSVFYGEIASWDSSGRHGWVKPDRPVPHINSFRRGGLIFVSNRDVDRGIEVGDAVMFYVYCDDRGLGAARVQARTKATASVQSTAAPLASPACAA